MTMGFICISLMTNDLKHISMYLLLICFVPQRTESLAQFLYCLLIAVGWVLSVKNKIHGQVPEKQYRN